MRYVASILGVLACFACLCPVAVSAASSDEGGGAPGDSVLKASAVKVYPDGSFDWDYMKENIPYINYVRDRLEAELYLLVTARATGAGGLEYTITLVGQRQYAGMDDTLLCYSEPAEASVTSRARVAKTLEMALMRYVARTPISERISIAYRGEARPTDLVDPWDSWVFSISLDPGVSGSQVSKLRSIYSSLSIDRVTSALKIGVFAYSSYSESEQELPSKTLNIIRRTNSLSALAVKSLGDHWGAGSTGKLFAQSYMNKKHYYEIAPAIEYSFFPYAESTRRSLALFSQVVFTDVTYQELTIYNKTAEKLWSYKLSLPGSIKEPWGTFRADITWQQYFHDSSIYRLSLYSSVSFQVAKGLWFSVGGAYYRTHDEIDQPRRTLTDEEILLNLKTLASTYDYAVSVGFTYTFGSIYSNVVNPRFLGD